MSPKHPSAPLNAALAKLGAAFDERVRRYGDSPQAAEHLDVRSQERRMQLLAEVGVAPDAKILDVGCGTGHLLPYLRRNYGFRGEYVGYDLSQEMVSLARRKFPEARFEQRNLLEDPVTEEFDVTFICGTFNDQMGRNQELIEDVLRAVKPITRRAISFNLLSRYVDYFDPHLYYADPGEVFRFCKEELSPRVSLRHDYETKPGVVPYEFSVYVYLTDIPCRKLAALP